MSRLKKLLLVALALGVVAVIVNVLDPTHSLSKLLKGQTTLQAQYVRHFKSPEPLEPIGSEDAKVQIKAFAQSANPCHEMTIDLLKEIAQALPERIRVEFVDTGTPEGQQALAGAQIACEAGLLINDQGQFEVEREGEKFTIEFHGPLEAMPPELFHLVLVQELQEQYGDDLGEEELAKLAAVFEERWPPGMLGPGGPFPPEAEEPPASPPSAEEALSSDSPRG
ncbi:MAG TPA: hypothetical protein EYP85_09110 [Armatimonadetes bacterium]|nr:hypothetical protein [Armatimonadota bacterium]